MCNSNGSNKCSKNRFLLLILFWKVEVSLRTIYKHIHTNISKFFDRKWPVKKGLFFFCCLIVSFLECLEMFEPFHILITSLWWFMNFYNIRTFNNGDFHANMTAIQWYLFTIHVCVICIKFIFMYETDKCMTDTSDYQTSAYCLN